MRLTIIETGLVPEALRAQFADYPAMFRDLLERAGAGFDYETVSLISGDALPAPESLEAVLITGSPAGVYDDVPWIAPLLDFIRTAAAAHVPQVGICFGHQAMAEALGGKVEKSARGWGVGLHTYDMAGCPDWAGASCPAQICVPASHQDQVVRQPPATQIVAASDFTPYAGLAWTEIPGLSFQCHPEFDGAYAAALYDLRRARLGEATADAAISSLAGPTDNDRLGRWIVAFLNAKARRH